MRKKHTKTFWRLFTACCLHQQRRRIGTSW